MPGRDFQNDEEESGGKVKIHEKAGMRKDRYSSLSYNSYVAIQIESKLNKRMGRNSSDEAFIIKPPSSYKNKGKAVNTTYGKSTKAGWA